MELFQATRACAAAGIGSRFLSAFEVDIQQAQKVLVVIILAADMCKMLNATSMSLSFATKHSLSFATKHLGSISWVHAGYNDVLDDAKMGWARYAHSMRVFVFNSGLFYIQPTLASLDLLDRIAYRLDHENGWDQAIFNEASCPGPYPDAASCQGNLFKPHCAAGTQCTCRFAPLVIHVNVSM